MSPKFRDWCSYKRKRFETERERDTHIREGHVKVGTEIGVMLPQVEDTWRHQYLGEAREGSHLSSQRGHGPPCKFWLS